MANDASHPAMKGMAEATQELTAKNARDAKFPVNGRQDMGNQGLTKRPMLWVTPFPELLGAAEKTTGEAEFKARIARATGAGEVIFEALEVGADAGDKVGDFLVGHGL